MDFYDEEAMASIIKRSAHILNVDISNDSIKHIASRSRGTPRVANRLLKRVRDYAQVMADGKISETVAIESLNKLEVDPLGLDQIDHKLLGSIIEKFSGGPVGLDTLASSINEDSDTIMDIYEPYLLQLGFLDRTPRGRMATRLAYEYLDREFKGPDSQQHRLI